MSEGKGREEKGWKGREGNEKILYSLYIPNQKHGWILFLLTVLPKTVGLK